MAANKLALFILILILSFLQILFALNMYPLIESDGVAFLPAAINFAQRHGLINDVYHITRLLNYNTFPAFYINYPPIFPMFFGWLYRITSNLHLNFAIVHILLIIFFVFVSIQRFEVFSSFKRIVILFCFLIAWNSQLNPGIGRPESLAQLFFLFLLVSLSLSNSHFLGLMSGFLVVLIGFTHPVMGIYSFFILAVFFSYRHTQWLTFIYLCLGSIGGLLLIIYLYPYDFQYLIKGIIRHGQIVINRSEFSFYKFTKYHFLNPDYSFYFLIFLLSFYLYSKIFFKLYIKVHSKSFFLLSHFCLLFSILYFTFQTIESSYNLYVLFPVFGFIFLYSTDFLLNGVKKYLIYLIFIFCTFGFFRRLVLFPIHIVKGKNIYIAKKELSECLTRKGKVFISTSMFILFDDMKNLTDDINDKEIEYIVQQQNYSSLLIPSDLPGFHICSSNFIPCDISLLDFKVASSPPGYQFVVYEKNKVK